MPQVILDSKCEVQVAEVKLLVCDRAISLLQLLVMHEDVFFGNDTIRLASHDVHRHFEETIVLSNICWCLSTILCLISFLGSVVVQPEMSSADPLHTHK